MWETLCPCPFFWRFVVALYVGAVAVLVAVLVWRCPFYAVAVAVLFAVAVVMVRTIYTGKLYLYIYTLLTVNSNILVTD